jgi:hypothetical protein
MNTKCLYRLVNGQWVHRSSKAQKTILRHFNEGSDGIEGTYDNPEALDKRLKGAQEVGMAEADARIVSIDADLKPSELTIKERNWEKWRRVFELLGDIELSAQPPKPPQLLAPAQEGHGPIVIPQTRLRRYYETLRLFDSTKIHGAFAGYLSNRDDSAKHLQVLFEESCGHFARYANGSETFTPEKRPDPWWQQKHRYRNDEAKALVAALKPETPDVSFSVASSPDGICLDFEPIDYETSPYRTTSETGKAIFEDGKPGKTSGGGGVDLLLRSAKDNLPIIAEVKAPGDTNMFLALVQTLTYAVEFTTPNQTERLKRSYPAYFSDLDLDEKCDIYLIYFAKASPKLLTETKSIADKLLQDPSSPVARRVRRIAFIEATEEIGATEGKPGKKPEFHCTHLAQQAL